MDEQKKFFQVLLDLGIIPDGSTVLLVSDEMIDDHHVTAIDAAHRNPSEGVAICVTAMMMGAELFTDNDGLNYVAGILDDTEPEPGDLN